MGHASGFIENVPTDLMLDQVRHDGKATTPIQRFAVKNP
jgi:hypothetical protein